MKHTFPLLIAFFAITACSQVDKKAQLEKLKSQQADLQTQIDSLQAQINRESKTTQEADLVMVTPMKATIFTHYIEVQAKVDGEDDVMVSAQTPGVVKTVNVKVGDQVSKGSVLATIDDQVYQKSMDELQSARDFANTVFKKQKALWDQKIGTEIQYLTAKNNLESLDKKLATVREQLDMTRIKSPIAGTVDQMELKVGQAVSPGMPGVRVVNFSKLKVKGEIAEAYVNRVNKGDAVEVVFPDLNKTINAHLSYSGKAIDAMNRTFKVEVNVDGAGRDLNPNMVAVMRVSDYTNTKAYILPISVVQSGTDGSYVFVMENGKAVKRTVKAGQTYNGNIEIMDGLKDGDNVITTGYQSLIDNQPVKL